MYSFTDIIPRATPKKRGWKEVFARNVTAHKKEAERKAENEVAAEQAKKAGLPELKGSEKQVAWAESIRKSALAAPKNCVLPAEAFEAKNPDAEQRAFYAVVSSARSRLENETSAKWWIDNRDIVDSYCFECGQNSRLS